VQFSLNPKQKLRGENFSCHVHAFRSSREDSLQKITGRKVSEVMAKQRRSGRAWTSVSLLNSKTSSVKTTSLRWPAEQLVSIFAA
jgi:hypothetical protein